MSRVGLAAALIIALGAPAHAQRQLTQNEIIGSIAGCMTETAPKDWKRLIFTLDQENPQRDNPGKTVSSHKAVAGKSAEGPARDIKPCRRPNWMNQAVQAFRETQDEKARLWTGITVTLERDGRYTINYRYPK